ncbi:MAG TPA: hypothetical protein VEI57_02630, partial [Nitrospirota bacterium]|nr:hypothetical protein [Nitrospirota bacterium]
MTLQNVRVLNALKRRLKKREHGISTYIRNHILAQYFPELDKYYGPSEALAVVRECLDPSVIVGMEYDDFCRTVAPGKMTLALERRVGAIWRTAVNSVGCTMGEAAFHEAQIAVDSLKRVRQEINVVEDKLEDACLAFPEYTYLLSIPGFGPDVSAKVLGGHRRSPPFYKQQTGFAVGGSRPVRETKWKDVKQGNADHLQTRKGRSAVCVVPGSVHCLT